MLKKIICLALALTLLLPLVSCSNGDFYPEIASTDEESRVMFTLAIGDDVYEVKYELYRTFFLTYKEKVDGGDDSVWTSEDAQMYVNEIDRMIIDAASNIYTVLHLAKKAGFDPFSSDVDRTIREYVKHSVDGYEDSNMSIAGYGGDYDAYLESLKEVYMNYSVQALIYRYAIAYDNLMLYYYGNIDSDNPTSDAQEGSIKYTDEDIRNYYYGQDSVRVLLASIDAKYMSEERAQQIRNNIASFSTEKSVINYILSMTSTTEADAANGILFGRYTMDSTLFSTTLADAAFDLSFHETSPLITYDTDSSTVYYIFYRTDKSDTYFENNKSDITASYIGNEIGRILMECKAELTSHVTRKEIMQEIDRSEIGMQ